MLEAASAKKGGFGRALNRNKSSNSETSIHMSRAAFSSSQGPSLEELAGVNDSKRNDSGSFSLAGDDDLDLDDLDGSSNV